MPPSPQPQPPAPVTIRIEGGFNGGQLMQSSPGASNSKPSPASRRLRTRQAGTGEHQCAKSADRPRRATQRAEHPASRQPSPRSGNAGDSGQYRGGDPGNWRRSAERSGAAEVAGHLEAATDQYQGSINGAAAPLCILGQRPKPKPKTGIEAAGAPSLQHCNPNGYIRYNRGPISSRNASMPALSPELIAMASDPTVKTNLLRKAWVARTSKQPNGQPGIKSMSCRAIQMVLCVYRRYRLLRGELKVRNPIRGLIPLWRPDSPGPIEFIIKSVGLSNRSASWKCWRPLSIRLSGICFLKRCCGNYEMQGIPMTPEVVLATNNCGLL